MSRFVKTLLAAAGFAFGWTELPAATAGQLTVWLGNAEGASFVGAIFRWDSDGNPRRSPDPTAKIDAPAVDAEGKGGAVRGGREAWTFSDLPKGKYDLVIVARERRLRVEGFQFAPVRELDPFLSPDARPDDDAREFIIGDIRKSPHYENKVEPLYLAGDAKAIRALVMLLRDKPTSYEGESPGAATLRHEIWQYSWRYGGWQKEKRTRVLDRVLMHRDDLRRWTWLWDVKLGGIEITNGPVEIRCDLPRQPGETQLRGLFPY